MTVSISCASTIAGDRTPSGFLSSAPSMSPSIIEDPELLQKSQRKEDKTAVAVAAAAATDSDDERKQQNTEATTSALFVNNIVDWDGPLDPERPRNWSSRRKACFIAVAALAICNVTFGSSVFAPAIKITTAEFNVSPLVMQLTVALWILGFAAGPLVYGPMSEMLGHQMLLYMGLGGLLVFQIPVAVAENVQTILVCRFFSGVFGSAIFSVVSGMTVELYEPIPRGVALAASSISINLGATIAPVVGGYLAYDASWRWTAWVTLIMAGVLIVASIFTVRETSSPKILRQKARRLRFETGNWALHAKSDEVRIEFDDIINRYLTKGIRMFVMEPILSIFTAYLTLVYGILYLAFQAFPVAYQQRGWSATSSFLPFLSVTLGIIASWGVISVFTLTWYKKKAEAHNGPPLPEYRLPPMIAGAVILPPALLWFGWSGNVHYISQIIAMFFIGLSLLLIFCSGIVYIVDVYQFHSNSAMSIHVVVRSLVSCSFPIFANVMYDNLGVAWASSVLALLTLVMVPAPIVFYIYGGTIRSWSRFAFNH